MGVAGRPFAHFSDADLVAAIEWMSNLLAEAGCGSSSATIAREDAEEARLRAYYTRPDIARNGSLELEEGVRWPYQRACALQQEKSSGYSGPRSARNPDELRRKIEAVLATMPATP